MISLFLLKVIAIHAYYLGVELDEEIKVSLTQVSILKPTRKLGLNESSLVKSQFLDSVQFTDHRFFSTEALELSATTQASGIFDSFSWLHNPNNNQDSFKLNNLELKANESFFSIKTGNKLETYSSQEAQYMILENIKNSLKKNYDFKGTVFAVPSFLSQSQRIYLKDLAQSSQLKPLSFVHEDSLSTLLVSIDRLDEKEKHVLAFNMKSGYVSASLVKLSAVTVNKGKVSEKKLENVQIVKTEYNFEFGWKDIQNHLAQTLIKTINEKCAVDISQDRLNLAKLKGKVLKIIKKLALGVMIIVKFDDIVENCKDSLEVNQSLIQDFVDINKEKIIKPVNKLLNPDFNVSSIILSHSSEVYLEKILSTIGKIKTPSNDHQVAVGAGLVATNYSDEVHVRHLVLNQNFQFLSKAEIISKTTGKIRSKTLFDRESLLGTSKKVGFSSDEDLIVKLEIDYGSGFEAVLEYEVVDLEFLAKKYLQTPFVALEFVLDDFGIVLLDRAEAKVEVELEFEKEIKKEKSKKEEKSTDNESMNNTENTNSTSESLKNETTTESATESTTDSTPEQAAEPTTENIDTQLDPSPATPSQSESTLPESPESTNSSETNSTNSTTSPDPSPESEEDQTPKYEKFLKKKSLKHSLSLIPQRTSTSFTSPLPTSSLSKLSALSSHEYKSSELASLQSSLIQTFESLSSSISSSDLQFFQSPDESLFISSLNSSSLQSCSPLSKCKTLLSKLNLLALHLSQRKNDYSALDSVKTFITSSFNSLEKDLKDLARAKPWLPSEEVADLAKEINLTQSSLLAAYDKQKESGPSAQIELTAARVQGKLARLAYKLQVLSKLKQKKTDL